MREAGTSVVPGIEVFLEERAAAYRGARIGLIANQASVDRGLRGALPLLMEKGRLRVSTLFAPEHGLAGGAQDMIPVPAERDTASGLTVHSLYGDGAKTLEPSEPMLEGVDCLIADLQDVGARYYTFAATIAMALEAIAKRGGRMVVLDRPNPIGGALTEGPGLEEGMRSFVGHVRVPVRHGLTMGELLRCHARREGIETALEVVPMRGWRRGMSYEETGLPWVPPSPNMASVETAWVYPGACLIEATNLSEGRGTTHPFEWIGAPWLEPGPYAEALRGMGLEGVAFRPLTFIPGFQKWVGQPCGGVALHVTDRGRFRPVRTGIALLIAARRLAPRHFAWRSEPYEFVSDRPAIDLLTGSEAARAAIEAGGGLDEATRGWREAEAAWETSRADLLLYT